MSVHMHREVEKLHEQLLEMSGRVEDMVRGSVAMLNDFQHERSGDFFAMDDEIDLLDVEIEEACLKVLALYHPYATDLRRITAVMQIASELERVADLAVNVVERATDMVSHGDIEVPEGVQDMATIAIDMLHQSIDAYVEGDTALAHRVRASDDRVDNLNRQLIHEITAKMTAEPLHVPALLNLFSAARQIEQVADHATIIAEDVVYLVDGSIIRHQPELVPSAQDEAS